MKKILSIFVCLLLFLSCVLPVRASGGVPDAVLEAAKSVVRIRSEYSGKTATGSGFVIKNEPEEVLIVTNDHVVDGKPRRISVWVGEDTLVDAQIVFTTSEKDLCVLRVTDPVDMQPLQLSREVPQHGAAIYAVGYPGAGDILSDTQAHTSDSVTITDGIISAIRTFTIEEGGDPVQLLQINAAINSGNSGGPLFDSDGMVIGVNTYKVNADSQGVFGSVAISELWSLLEKHGIETSETLGQTKEAEDVSIPLLPILAGAGAVCLAFLLFALARRKKSSRQPKHRQTVTLRNLMDKHPNGLDTGAAVSLLLPVAVQLRNLHNEGKLHLQLCPENILLRKDGAVLRQASAQETGRFNSGFAAPEIYRGAGFGITSDVYSFAAVLLYALTGAIPANSLQAEDLTRELDSLEDTSLREILRKAKAPNILDRTQSMQELIYSIAVFNAPVPEPEAKPQKQPKVKAPSPHRASVRKKPKRKPRLLPLAAVFACVAAAILLWPEGAVPTPDTALHATETATEATRSLSAEELAYRQAESWAADGQLGRAAIAFGKLGDYSDARQRSFALWDQFTPRTVYNGSMVLKKDGTAVKIRNASDDHPILKQSDLVDLAGLKADGTVVSSDLDVSGWKDIVAAVSGSTYYMIAYTRNSSSSYCESYMIGLKSNGTVVATGDNLWGHLDISGWTDIIAIYVGSYGTTDVTDQFGQKATAKNYLQVTGTNYYTVGLKYDGTLVTAGKIPESWDLTQWTDIVKLSISGEYMAGLKSDGTVIATHYDVSDWKNITDINAGEYHVLGLRADGTVAATGNRYVYHHLEVEDWSDIVSISASNHHTVGLKEDGTVVVVGVSTGTLLDVCDVSDWKEIVAIDAANHYTVGWCADGTAVIAGWEPNDYCTDVKMPAKLLPARNGSETKP